MRGLRVEMFSTIDGYGGGDGPTGDGPGYLGYGTPGMIEWMQEQLAEEQALLMGATTYRQMSEMVTGGDDSTLPLMTGLPKIVFSRTVKPPLMWANTTIVDQSVETAVPALKAIADGVPMRTLGSRSPRRQPRPARPGRPDPGAGVPDDLGRDRGRSPSSRGCPTSIWRSPAPP